jgi:beta-barrel assembly-enhancing protease
MAASISCSQNGKADESGRRKVHMRERTVGARVLALLLALLMATPWALGVTEPPELPNPGTVAVSKQQQEQLGLKAMSEVYQQMPVLPDSSPVTQYVQQLGKRLVQVIPQQNSWPYQFHVIPQKDVNAFALPGGPIFINVGTILAAENEAQLAGVMSHEMSHVYMQHQVKEMQKSGMTQGVAGIVGGILGAVLGGTAGTLANMGAQYAGGILSLKYSRQEEAQADAVGAVIIYKAGYNPRSLAEFFQKLEKQGGGGGPQFLSDHPNPGNRVEAVDTEIRDWPPKSYRGSTPEFANARQDAGRVRLYSAQEIAQQAKQGTWARENERNGSVPASVRNVSGGNETAQPRIANVSYQDVRPSGNFRQLRQGPVSIAYPENWEPVSSQNSDGITIGPPAGISSGAVAYGVIIGGGQDQNANSLDQATQDLIQGMEQSNPGLRQQGSPRRIQVNGIEGRSVTLSGSSPIEQNGRPLSERDWLVTLPDSQGGLLYLVFIAPEKDFGQLRSTYERMLDSLQVR